MDINQTGMQEVELMRKEVEFLRKRVDLLKQEKQQNVLSSDPFAYGYKFTLGRAWASFLLSIPALIFTILFVVFVFSILSPLFTVQ